VLPLLGKRTSPEKTNASQRLRRFILTSVDSSRRPNAFCSSFSGFGFSCYGAAARQQNLKT
jgi:hypothetical protein